MRDVGVPRQLYTLVFGESIFNDAITIVLYRTYTAFLTEDPVWTDYVLLAGSFFYTFLLSLCLGLIVAVLVSVLLKHIERSNPTNRLQIEASAIVFGPWVCYLVAEALQLSGIVSILFAGIAMARYTVPNLSDLSRAVVAKAYSVCAHAAEVLVFIFLGLGLFSFDLSFSSLGIGLFTVAFAATLIARACNVVFCSSLLNCFRRRKISIGSQLTIWASAPRGAVAFALAISAERVLGHEGEVMLTFTLLYSILSVRSMQIFLVSLSLPPMLQCLAIAEEEEAQEFDVSAMDDNTTCLKRLKTSIQTFELAYLYPCFVTEDGSSTEKLEIEDTPIQLEIDAKLKQNHSLSHKSESSRELQDLDIIGSDTYVHSAIHLN